MTEELAQIIRSNSEPLEPVATNVEPRLSSFDGVRVVLFDVYGTMLISGSGDVGTAQETSRAEALIDAFAAMKVDYLGDADAGIKCLLSTIGRHHKLSRESGVEYPEVDIVEVWRDVCKQYASQRWID